MVYNIWLLKINLVKDEKEADNDSLTGNQLLTNLKKDIELKNSSDKNILINSKKSTLDDEIFLQKKKTKVGKEFSTFEVSDNVRRAYELGADTIFFDSCFKGPNHESTPLSLRADANDSLEFLAAITKLRQQFVRNDNTLLIENEFDNNNEYDDSNINNETFEYIGGFDIIYCFL